MNRISVNPSDTIGKINPNIYGHFAEHLGRCIYDGLWVGEDSKIPNTRGFRDDAVQALRRIRIPVLRWPGGCFADDYHWQDGLGPRKDRPRRINIHWGEVIESNDVGTHEFIDLCRQLGTQPYFNANLGSGTVREMRDWVEYCNFPGDSSWARLRSENGHPAPMDVTYWGIGNESWGCGGNFSPEDYCTEFRRYASYVRGFGKQLYLVACGPSGNDTDWTVRFFRKLRKDYWDFGNIHGFSAHYYCGTAGTATEYTTDQWYELIAKGLEMEKLVVQQRAAMDAFDPNRQIGLIVDEWGTWHPPEKAANPAFLYQQNTMRDALVAATTLDIFNRHADKVAMANIAQIVNVLQALVLTEKEKMLVTPTGHVFGMYAAHQGGRAVRLAVESEKISFARGSGTGSIDAVAASASVKEKTLFLTLTNASAGKSTEVEIGLLAGSRAESATGRVLCGEIRDRNTFERPDKLAPADLAVKAAGSSFKVELPAASVTGLEIRLS